MMGSFFSTVALGFAAFISTNVDDIFILLLFFSNPRMRRSSVVMGQFIGIISIIIVSLVGAFIATQLVSFELLGLLGVIPVVFGLMALQKNKSEDEEDESSAKLKSGSVVLTVALVTFANGGDNVSVYVPLFSTRTFVQAAILTGVFLALTGVWCVGASYLVRHPKLKRQIKKYGPLAFPWVLIVLGIAILLEAYA